MCPPAKIEQISKQMVYESAVVVFMDVDLL